MGGRGKLGAVAVVVFVTMAVSGVDGAPDGEAPETSVDSRAGEGEDVVLAAFQERPDEPVRRFRARRRMHAVGLGREAFMEVLVELDPEEGFRWTIEAEGGSGLIRNKAFRRLLEEEARVRGTNRADEAALTAANYELRADGAADGDLVRLRAIPRRKEVGLIDGTILVTRDTADLVRIEGRLVRTPSFWVTRVEVVRLYRRLGGHRVVTRIESVAHIRLLGRVRVTIDFAYEMIDGDELGPEDAPASPLSVARDRPASPDDPDLAVTTPAARAREATYR